MIETLEPGLQCCCIEVHQKAYGKSRELEIGDYLCRVDRVETVDSFEFDDDAAADEQIYLESGLQPVTLEVEWNEFLDLDWNSCLPQNDYQTLLVRWIPVAPAPIHDALRWRRRSPRS